MSTVISVVYKLPVEIIEQILSYNNLDIRDLVNFSSTCHHFRSFVNNINATWKKKFFKRWPYFCDLFNEHHYDWYQETKICMQYHNKTLKTLVKMSTRFYKRQELSDTDMNDWKDMMTEHPRAYYYILNQLMNIVNNDSEITSIDVVPMTTPGNKTLKYYGIKVLRFVRQQHLANEWNEYMSRPADEQILERGAVLVAQWCQPTQNVAVEDISNQLTELANIVKEYIKSYHPRHPIFNIDQSNLEYWKTHNLTENQWNGTDCKQIIEAMNIVLFREMRFRGNNDIDYAFDNSCINSVLEKRSGSPITLSIIYEAIARRLGVKFETASFPSHFLLTWSEGFDYGESFYIDAFNKGQIIARSTSPRLSYNQKGIRKFTLGGASARQVVEKIVNNLDCTGNRRAKQITRLRLTLELMHLVSPTDMTYVHNLARFYMLYDMDTKNLMESLIEIEPELDEKGKSDAKLIIQMMKEHDAHSKESKNLLYPKVQIHKRTPSVKFAVGMVMKHQRYYYNCVIYDWDPKCLQSPEWQARMTVDKLKYQANQPFYHVIAEDGSYRYAAQENILPSNSVDCLNEIGEISRYFSHYYRNHYVPNEEKQAEYPEDEAVRKFYCQNYNF